MIGTLIFVTSLIIAGLYLWKTKSKMFLGTGPAAQFKPKLKHFITPAVIIILGILIANINPFKIERIESGGIGLKIKLIGDERGISKYTYATGWVVYNNWAEYIHEVSTTLQHIEYPAQQIILKGGFSATITPTFNYEVVPENAGDMYQHLKADLGEIQQGWLKTAVLGAINDEANRWAPDSVFNHREAFEGGIIAQCNKTVSKWFKVTQLRTGITPPPALQKSIDEKTDAMQKIQVAESTRKVADAKYFEKVAFARGDSADMVIRAAGKAEAIRREQAQLSQLYIDYKKVEKWNGEGPTTILGNSGTPIIQLK